MEVKDGGMSNSIAEEVKKDERGPLTEVSKDERDSEEEIWRGRREIMNNALAASAGGQDPAKACKYARKLAHVIKGGKVDEFLSLINDLNDPLLRYTDWSTVLNSRLNGNESLIHVAAANEKDDILRLLVDYVGDRLITAQTDLGYTPLHYVAQLGGSTGAAQMLIRRARDLPNAAKDKNLFLRMKSKWGDTALHLAVRGGHANLVHYLLSENMELAYWKDASDKSPLYLALYIKDSATHEALFSLSLEPSRIEGLPPIHGAILLERRELFELILKKNMKLFAMTDSTGGNVFHLAAYLNQAWVFEFLKPETRYLIRARDMNGDLPIHIASKMGYVEHIEKLREVSKLRNGQGQTVLHVAAKYGRVSVVRYILSDPDLRELLNQDDFDGNTALHLAAMHSQPAALIHLLQTDGIQLGIINNKCSLAVDIARQHLAMGYDIRQQLAYLALLCSLAEKASFVPELFLVRAEARDEFLSVVRSRKSMPSRDIVKDYINSRMVVATLVATVTFAAGFAVPGGFNSSDTASKDDRGMATMLDNRMFQAFAICNTIAMFCSMTAVVNLIWAQIVDINIAVAAFERTTLPLQIALPAMSTAFLTGVTLTVGKLPWLANTIFYLGLVFLLIISFAKLLEKPPIFKICGHPLRRLTFWLILAFIYLWRVETYIYDANDAKDNRREKKTSASPPGNVAGESRTDDSAKAKCEDALHPPSH